MIRFLVVVLGLVLAFPALAQQRVVIQNGTTAVSNSNPLPVTASITPSGTQNVNLTQILGAAPSLTNPLWVFPATGATFPVSGTVAVTQSTSPWIVAGGGTAGSAASGVLTIQGIASMTPVQVSQATAANLNATVVGTGTFAVQATLSAETTKVIGTVNQGTSPWVTSGTVTANIGTDPTQAPVAPATATATKSTLIGAQATTGAVNPTNTQQSALSSDTNNNLLVSAGGAPNLATAQVSVTTGNITVAAARALRRAVTITNITGTGPIYCGNTGVSTSTGTYLGASTGSAITLNTTAGIFCTVASVTQTVSVAETY